MDNAFCSSYNNSSNKRKSLLEKNKFQEFPIEQIRQNSSINL